MRHTRLAATVAAMIAAAGVAAPASASPPTDASASLDLPAGVACPFPLRLDFTGKSKTINLPGGRMIITSPGLKVTVTNTASGRSVDLNITGAQQVITREDGATETVATGHNLLLDPVAGFVHTSGRFSFVFDAAGNLIQPLQGQGTTTDVCAVLS